MTQHVFLMDITRHTGPMQVMMFTARAHADSFSSSRIVWLHSPIQTIVQRVSEELICISSGSAAGTVKAKLTDLANNGEAEAMFHVLSYDGPTLREASALSASGIKIKVQSFTSLKPKSPIPIGLPSAAALPTSAPITLDEAIKLTQEVLLKSGHTTPETSLFQNRLRGLLNQHDSRTQNNPLVPKSHTLIRDIVSAGLRDGWLARRLIGGKAGTESVWLIKPQATLASEVPTVRSEAALLAEKKTSDIIAALKQRGLYAPKDIRDALLENVLTQSLDVTVTKLFRNASIKAQETSGLNFIHWRPAVDSVTNLAIRAGVLFDTSKTVIPDSFTSRGAIVGNVDQDAINKCDQYLMVATIASISGLTVRDAPAIAHALFKQAPSKISQDDMIDKAYEVLSQLGGKLEQQNDGSLTVI